MSTPIGHSLVGIAFSRILGQPSIVPNWRWYFFGIFAANAPDLDFLAGAIQGDINLYHQGISHSFLAAIFFGSVAALMLPRLLACKPVLVLTTGVSFYASHLLLDYFRADQREPFGMPLLWPMSDQHWTSPITIFQGIKHGDPGDSFSVFIDQIFSQHNMFAIGTELVILLPIVLITILATRNKWSKQHANQSD